MKIALFGATGRTGQFILEEALEAGMFVTVYARDPTAITATSRRLKLVDGAAHDPDRVAYAVRGCDVVLSAVSAG